MIITGMKVFRGIMIFSLLFLMGNIALGFYHGTTDEMTMEFTIFISCGLLYGIVEYQKKEPVHKKK